MRATDIRIYLEALQANRVFIQMVGETPNKKRVRIFTILNPIHNPNKPYIHSFHPMLEKLGYKMDKYQNILVLEAHQAQVEILSTLLECAKITPEEFNELKQKVYS